MVKIFENKRQVDHWYSQSTLELASALRTELHYLGTEQFNSSGRFKAYENALEALGDIKRGLYKGFKVEQEPRIISGDELVKKLNQ